MNEVDWQMLGRTVLRLEKQQQEDMQQVRESIAELGKRVANLEECMDGENI